MKIERPRASEVTREVARAVDEGVDGRAVGPRGGRAGADADGGLGGGALTKCGVSRTRSDSGVEVYALA